jgi:outer membrane protein TolC
MLFVIIPLLFCYQKASSQEIISNISHFDLEKVWKYTLENHKQLKTIELQLDNKQENIKSSKSSRYPNINLQGSYSRLSDMPLYDDGFLNKPTVVKINSTNYSSSLSSDILLYNGSIKTRDIKIQETELYSIKTLLKLSSAEVKLESTKLFYALIQNTYYKQLVEKEILQDEKQLKEIVSLYKNGTILKSDVLRAEVMLSNHQMLLTEINNDFLIIQQQLNLIMGRNDLEQIIPEYNEIDDISLINSSYEEYLGKALDNAFELKIADNNIQVEQLKLKQIESAIFPKLSLFADYNFNYPQSKSYPYSDALYGIGQVGLKLNIPISNLYHTKHQKNSQKISILEQEINKQKKTDQIKNELRASFVKFTETLERIEVAQKNINQTTETLRIIRNSYFNQQSLLTDLLNAETQLLQAQFDFTSAKIKAQVEYYQIQKIIGNI